MLIAEIHGKRCPDIEGLEDLFTSAVFGHLRSIPPKFFWSALFSKAWNRENPPCSLHEKLRNVGVDLSVYSSLDIAFWRSFEAFGEPDLILCFTEPNYATILVLVEVKLNSSKSGSGENDQLAKYLRLLEDANATAKWQTTENSRFLIYLTRNFASDEMDESLRSYATTGGDARPVLFGLEWRDVLETANAFAAANVGSQAAMLLSEVADFLEVRGFDGFGGFKVTGSSNTLGGSFYQRLYFTQHELRVSVSCGGHFYGN